MPSATPHPLALGPVAAADQAPALALVFRGLVGDDQLDQIADLLGGGSLDGLLGAYRDGRFVGAGFVQPQPGRVAMVWYPRLVASEPLMTAVELLRGLCRRATERGVRMVQCLLRTAGKAETAVLERAGFSTLSKLFYLVSQTADFPQTAPASDLTFEPYSDATRGRLVRVIEATYQGTLDCPALNGVRPIDEVLEGYRASGVFDPQRWLLISHGGQDVGCLLLADYPDQENWELVYMGVRSEFRGRNWGLAITRQAQWLARQAQRPRLVLAVDAANAPALRMYAAAGFRAWDQRSVFLRVVPSSNEATAGDRSP